jgi:hypothetical protein
VLKFAGEVSFVDFDEFSGLADGLQTSLQFFFTVQMLESDAH